MIKYYKRTVKDEGLVELADFKTGSWILAEDPTEEEINSLAEKLGLEHGHLTDALDPNEVPRLEMEHGVPYIFTRTPFKQKDGYITIPILLVLGSNFLLSVTPKETELFDKFTNQEIPFSTTQKLKLFILMIREINNRFVRALNAINRDIYVVSNSPEKISNKDILNLVRYEQMINDFLNALVRTSTILNNLLSGKTVRLYEEDRDLIEDLFLANGQLVDLAKNTLQTVKNLRDAYSTILTNNLNQVVKLFTSLTVVMTVPTMIASFYGMNVALPLSDHPAAFGLIALGAVTLSAILIYVFSKNDWL